MRIAVGEIVVVGLFGKPRKDSQVWGPFPDGVSADAFIDKLKEDPDNEFIDFGSFVVQAPPRTEAQRWDERQGKRHDPRRRRRGSGA